jgi:outer membrane lipoprotein-sorting protein
MKEEITMFVRKWSTLATVLAVALACAAAAAAPVTAPTPEDIWQRSRAVYEGLTSYADTGVVLVEAPSISESHAFTTRFQAPRRLYFDFVKNEDVDRYVIWSDAEAFHTWWQTTGVEDEYPRGSGIGAFAQADYLTTGSALKLPPLIFPQSGLQGPLTNFKDFVLDGTEKIGGSTCYRLAGRTSDIYTATGREVNIRKMTVWIDSETLLIRKIFEDTPKGVPVSQFMHTTTTFEPQLNPALKDDAFDFEAPTVNQE